MQTADVDRAIACSPFSGRTAKHVPAPSRHRRLALAVSLGTALASGHLRPRELSLAIEVLNCLARDTEVELRRALAEHVKASPLLPRGLALRLAADVEAVALPILQASPVLTDDDLVAVIGEGDTARQQAIAGRASLSERVSGALVDTGERAVVSRLLVNEGAAISEGSYRLLLQTFGDDAAIQELLVGRPVLPFEIKERLIDMVSEALRDRLVRLHDLPPALADQLRRQGGERALVESLAALHSAKEIDAAAERLHRQAALTPTLLLRALAAGRLEFFGAAMAALAGVPGSKARNALRKAGAPALVSLYERASLPAHLQSAFQVVLGVVLEQRRAGRTTAQPDDERRMVLDLVRRYRQISPEGLESVICQLGRLSAVEPGLLRL